MGSDNQRFVCKVRKPKVEVLLAPFIVYRLLPLRSRRFESSNGDSLSIIDEANQTVYVLSHENFCLDDVKHKLAMANDSPPDKDEIEESESEIDDELRELLSNIVTESQDNL